MAAWVRGHVTFSCNHQGKPSASITEFQGFLGSIVTDSASSLLCAVVSGISKLDRTETLGNANKQRSKRTNKTIYRTIICFLITNFSIVDGCVLTYLPCNLDVITWESSNNFLLYLSNKPPIKCLHCGHVPIHYFAILDSVLLDSQIFDRQVYMAAIAEWVFRLFERIHCRSRNFDNYLPKYSPSFASQAVFPRVCNRLDLAPP